MIKNLMSQNIRNNENYIGLQNEQNDYVAKHSKLRKTTKVIKLR